MNEEEGLVLEESDHELVKEQEAMIAAAVIIAPFFFFYFVLGKIVDLCRFIGGWLVELGGVATIILFNVAKEFLNDEAEWLRGEDMTKRRAK